MPLLTPTNATTSGGGVSASSLLIEELSAAGGQQRRSLLLKGACLPLQGAEWSGENNVKTTWLPGNSRATRQVIGPKILPSSWTGEWHLVQLLLTPAEWADGDGALGGIGATVSEPMRLFEIFESIRVAARLLRVTWAVLGAGFGGNKSGRIVCEGGLDKFGAKFDRMEDATWEATFNWVSRGAMQAPARSSNSASLATSSNRVKAATSQLANAATGSPLQAFDPSVAGSASFLTLGAYEGLSPGLEAMVLSTTLSLVGLASGVATATALGAQLTTTPVAVTQSAVAQARDATEQANDALDRLGRAPFERMTTKPYVGDALVAWLRYQQVEEALEDLATETITLRDQLQATQASPALGAKRSAKGVQPSQGSQTYTCKAGDTPETVSEQFYETDTYGRLICTANGLPWHWAGFYPGQVLIIPPIGALPQP